MLHNLLFAPAPAATEDTSAGTKPPNFNAGWMSRLGPMDDEPEKPVKPKETDGTKDTPERPDTTLPGDGLGVADDTATTKPAAPKTAEDAPAKDKADAAAKPKPTEEEEKWPRSSADWDKFKKKRAEREGSLRADLEVSNTQLTELRAKFDEAQAKLSARPEIDPEIQSEVERLRAENKAMHEAFMVTEVTADPKFKEHFDTRTNAAIGDAKASVAPEQAERVERILRLPEGEYRNVQLDELLSELESDSAKLDIRLAVKDLRIIARDRDAAIKDAEALKSTRNGQRAASAEKTSKMFEQTFHATVKALQDPKTGMVLFQTKEGDDAWNKGVKERVEGAAKLLSDKNVKPAEIVKAALLARAFPDLLKSYEADWREWDAQKTKLEAQVKDLTAAQPRTTGNGSNSAGEPASSVKPGMSPTERSSAWAADMRKAWPGV